MTYYRIYAHKIPIAGINGLKTFHDQGFWLFTATDGMNFKGNRISTCFERNRLDFFITNL